MKGISGRQDAILRFIKDFYHDTRYPPTIREIQEHCRITSTSVVDYNLKALEEKGYIRRNKKISRGLELTELGGAPSAPAALFQVPLVGEIAAGLPIPVLDDLATGEFAESVEMSSTLLPGRRDGLFALKVRGYSMVDALINDGDIVILRHAQTCDNGDTVAVWLRAERETTLKRFYHEGDRVRLQPANVTMLPIYCDPANVEVQGKLVGVLRSIQ
ncbi:MAG: repressor LexA [Chloroflexi bacterium]|nr:repressor LexA [Chloroflexota bacterium]